MNYGVYVSQSCEIPAVSFEERKARPMRSLASISGAVIELNLAPAGGDVDGVTWADVLQLPAGLPVNLNRSAG